MPNIELLNRTLDHIKTNPETWDQGRWCGTLQCFAGWAVTLAGIYIDQLREVVHVADMPAELAVQVDPDRESLTVREAAVLALDIGDSLLLDDVAYGANEMLPAAEVLFYAGNEMDDLERHVGRLCSETAEVGAR